MNDGNGLKGSTQPAPMISGNGPFKQQTRPED